MPMFKEKNAYVLVSSLYGPTPELCDLTGYVHFS